MCIHIEFLCREFALIQYVGVLLLYPVIFDFQFSHHAVNCPNLRAIVEIEFDLRPCEAHHAQMKDFSVML